ncbi:MAG: hypothetical protein ABIV47_01590 [Roseiflexaceae bacterium]
MSEPPALTADDTNVPVVEVEQVVERLKQNGVPIEDILFPLRISWLLQDREPDSLDYDAAALVYTLSKTRDQ